MDHPYVKYRKQAGLVRLGTMAVILCYHLLLYGFFLLLWLWLADHVFHAPRPITQQITSWKDITALAFALLPPLALSIITVHTLPLIFGRPKVEVFRDFRVYLFTERINRLFRWRLISSERFEKLIETKRRGEY